MTSLIWHNTLSQAWRPSENTYRGFSDGQNPAFARIAAAPSLTAALRAGDARALAGSLHNDLQAAALDLRPELARVIAVAEEAGALRAIVSGSGPTIAALVEDPGSAQRVSRALKASGLVADVLRADAPVAGARVVG